MSPGAIKRAIDAEVSSVAVDDTELGKARAVLGTVLDRGKYSKDELVESLTSPPGEDYMDTTMVRFLRARRGNVKAAADMIEEAMDFRRRHDVDNIMSKPLSRVVLKHLRGGVYDGLLPDFDKFGRPVYLLQGGASDTAIQTLLKPPPGYEEWSLADFEDALLHWHLILMEYITKVLFLEATKKAGKIINKYVVIDDLKGFSFAGLRGLMSVMTAFKKSAFIDQLLYPEILSFLVFLNSPAIFRGPWAIIKGFIDKHTVEKIFVLGGHSQYSPVLDSIFENDKIPAFLGGTLEETVVTSIEKPEAVEYHKIDRMCLENAKNSGYNPETSRVGPLHILHISNGKESQVSLEVKPYEVAEWQVCIDSHDIYYEAMFIPHDGEPAVVIDPRRKTHNSDVRLEYRFMNSQARGKVILVFCNKKSKIRSKTVRYRIYLTKQCDDAQSECKASDQVAIEN
uniref:CRAL-TRIO domain-containing protein n=1 Tax=Mucochytrium quahogii TaxID=96639 RepID=A0A7S2S475_9STRA|mmetsp:Transcript_4693/g.7054  ORF Transcript_4693/g.7054 Transcript_4693/m.7054 type:complete len:454 (+) Transcript_4693:184-1545(+)